MAFGLGGCPHAGGHIGPPQPVEWMAMRRSWASVDLQHVQFYRFLPRLDDSGGPTAGSYHALLLGQFCGSHTGMIQYTHIHAPQTMYRGSGMVIYVHNLYDPKRFPLFGQKGRIGLILLSGAGMRRFFSLLPGYELISAVTFCCSTRSSVRWFYTVRCKIPTDISPLRLGLVSP